jgi:hypothetical protein
MTRRLVFTLIPLLFALHSLEEGAVAGRVLPSIEARVPEDVRGVTAAALTPTRFHAALTVLTAVVFVIAFSGSPAAPGSRRGYLLLAIEATLLVNVMSHAIAAAWVGGYVPGLVTAVAVNLPFSAYVLRRAWRERWYSRRALVLLAPLALALHGPLLIGMIALVGA